MAVSEAPRRASVKSTQEYEDEAAALLAGSALPPMATPQAEDLTSLGSMTMKELKKVANQRGISDEEVEEVADNATGNPKDAVRELIQSKAREEEARLAAERQQEEERKAIEEAAKVQAELERQAAERQQEEEKKAREEAKEAAVPMAPSASVEAETKSAPPAKKAPMSNLTPSERKEANMQAELYALFVTMEHLEGAFVKGLLSNEDYKKHCDQMGAQFKTLSKALQHLKIEDWYAQNELQCPLAKERFVMGVSAIDEYGGSDTKGKSGLAQGVMEATENFITLTNAFEMNYRSCEQILPLLKDLQTSIAVLPNLGSSEGGSAMERMKQWMVKVNNKHAREELSDDDFAQLKLDTEIAYSNLRNYAKTIS